MEQTGTVHCKKRSVYGTNRNSSLNKQEQFIEKEDEFIEQTGTVH